MGTGHRETLQVSLPASRGESHPDTTQLRTKNAYLSLIIVKKSASCRVAPHAVIILW
jgi:hypothetical protein